MHPLSIIFYTISRLFLILFLKLNIMIIFEIIYNVLYKFIKPHRTYKRSKKQSIAIITGGTKGIGLQLVRRLIDLNYQVIILSRDIKKMKELQKYYGNRLRYEYLDLSQLSTIISTISKLNLKEVDLLINNAGVYYRKIIKKDGIELNMLVNFMGHYLLTQQIDAKRVVNVSSSVIYSIKSVKERRYDIFMDNYAQSKVAMLLHTLYLKRINVEAVAVHPGIVATNLFDNTIYGKVVGFFYKMCPCVFTSVEDAAESVLYACFVKELSSDKEDVDFYMYGERAKVPKYVNHNNMLKVIEYAHTTIHGRVTADK